MMPIITRIEVIFHVIVAELFDTISELSSPLRRHPPLTAREDTLSIEARMESVSSLLRIVCSAMEFIPTVPYSRM